MENDVVAAPSFAHHCAICGAWEGKVLVEDGATGIYFCSEDIEEEYRRSGRPGTDLF
jgi:methionine synthase I (cobalamin-dependent)